MKRDSLSFQLTLRTFFWTFALLLTCWALFYFSLRRTFAQQDDEDLSDRTVTIQSLLQEEPGDPRRLVRRVEKEWAARQFERIYARVADSNGEIVTQTPGLLPEQGRFFEDLLKKSPADSMESADLGGQFYRARVSSVSVPEAGMKSPYHILVALERTSEESVLQRFRGFLIFVVTFGALASWWIGRGTVRIALAPVRKISEIAHEINSSSLKGRIDVTDQPEEFREIATAFNAMLDRLGESIERLSRFSVDMAHELRTPVHILMGSIEVALSRPRPNEEYRNALVSSLEEGERLKKIIESLLFIARSRDPAMEVQKEPLHLRQELEEILSFYEVLAQQAGMDVELEVPDENLNLQAERTLFQRAVGNILTNAIRYAGAGTSVRLRAYSRDGKIAVQVADRGPGIPEEALKNIGERFFRPEASRSKSSGGTGLGLSIVKSILHVHHGRVEIESGRDQGTVVTLLFPKDDEIVI